MSPPFGHLDTRSIVMLDEDECFRLLSLDTFGRVVHIRHAMPAIVPVNYVMDGQDILLRIDPRSQLGQAIDGTVVAFEIDTIDRSTNTGWSVVVVGAAKAVGDHGLDHDETDDEGSWVPGWRTPLVRITPAEVMGRIVVPPPIDG